MLGSKKWKIFTPVVRLVIFYVGGFFLGGVLLFFNSVQFVLWILFCTATFLYLYFYTEVAFVRICQRNSIIDNLWFSMFNLHNNDLVVLMSGLMKKITYCQLCCPFYVVNNICYNNIKNCRNIMSSEVSLW